MQMLHSKRFFSSLGWSCLCLFFASSVFGSLAAASLLRDAEAELKVLSASFKFTEGPVADQDGNVYFTDQPNDRIMIWTTKGELKTFLQPSGRSNGLFFDRQGNLLACADEKNELWSITPDKKITVLVKNYQGKLLNAPNDLWVDPSGGIYFTDPFYRRDYWDRQDKEIEDENVYYLPPDRSALTIAAGDFKRPNGIVGTPDGKFLYVADLSGRKTYRFALGPNGALSQRTLFVEQGSDGMTMDALGNVYLTGRGVSVYSPEGEKIDQIPLPDRWTANVCFGGANRDVLFITSQDSLFSIQMKVKGAF